MDYLKNFFIACATFILQMFARIEKFLGVNKKFARKNHLILKKATKSLGSKALRQIFHGPLCMFSADKSKLYQELDAQRSILERYKTSGGLTTKQLETLLPPATKETDSMAFDVSLLFALLKSKDICKYLREPTHGWDEEPLLLDVTDEANAVRIHRARNRIYSSATSISEYSDSTQVEKTWSIIGAACQQILKCHQKDIYAYSPVRFFFLRRVGITLLSILPAVLEWIITMLVGAFQWLRQFTVTKRPQHVLIRDRTDNVDIFVERQTLLDNLTSEIKQRKPNQVGLALTGFGGVGKTETARAICNTLNNEHETVYENVAWIEADDKDKLNTNLKVLFEKLPAKEEVPENIRVVAHKVYQKLHGTKTLIVLDNVATYKDIEDILPGENFTNVFVIVTSQSKKWPNNQFIVKDIDVYTPKEAQHFVASKLKNIIQETDQEEVEELVKDLGFLPLAISQFVSFLNVNTDISIRHYRQKFNNIKEIGITENVDGYERTVSRTWEITKERLEQDSPALVPLYQVLAFFDGQSIELDLLFQHALDITKGKPANNTLFADTVEKIFGNLEYGIRKAITKLKEYSLISVVNNPDNTKIVKIHSLMQLATRADLSKKTSPDDRLTTAYIALRTLHNIQEKDHPAADETHKKAYFDYGQKWSKHVVYLIRSCQRRGFEALLAEYLSLDKEFLLKDALLSRGNYQTCLEIYQILSSSANINNIDNETLLEISYITAYSSLKNGKYKTALEEFEKLIQLGTLPEERQIEIEYFIGHCLMKSESYDKAIQALNNVQRRQLDISSEYSKTYLLTCHDIGYCKFKKSSYVEALAEYQRILPLQREHVGVSHKDTLLTSHSLGHCLIDMGRYEEARDSLQETLEKKTKAFGELHHETLITHHTLGLVLMHLKEYERAEQIFGDVFENKKKALGPNHPSTLVTHHRVANCHLRQSNVDQALSIFQEVYKKRVEVLGAEKERTLLTHNDIAMCYVEKKEYAKAIEIFEEVYKVQERLFTKKKVNTFTTKFNLAMCYKDRPNNEEEKMADYQKALEMLQEVLGLQENHYGAGNDKLNTTISHLSICQDLLNREGKKDA